MSIIEKLGLDWWFTSHFAYGIIQMVFIPILVPTFILEQTGNATQVGVAMGIIGLGGLAAPVLGGLADKFRAHRAVQLIGLVAYALAALTFAVSGATFSLHLLGAIFLGVGSASLLMINPAFIVSGGYEPEEEAKKLTGLNQIAIVGSLVAGLGLAAVTKAGASFEARFILMFAIASAALVVTFLTNKAAAQRIVSETPSEDGSSEAEESSGFMSIILSRFGLVLLAIFFVSIGQGVITGQFPNYMGDVFKIDASLASVALSVSAVVSLIVLSLVGRAMAVKGPNPIWILAVLLKLIVMAGLAFIAFTGEGVGAYLPLALYVLYLQGVTSVDMVQPAIAAKTSRAGAGMTQGLLMFAIAGAYAGGNVISGVSADTLGWASLAWIVAIVSGIALVLGFMALAGRK